MEKIPRWRCDVLVIGAGPAGSCAAQAAASAGAEVIQIDRRPVIGAPARCAGFVPVPVLRPADHPERLVAQRVDTMLTFTPDGRCWESASPGYIVYRELLDSSLAGRARRAGVRVVAGARALSRNKRTTLIKTANGFAEIEAAVTIGADGPKSVAGSWAGIFNRSLIIAAQWTVPLLDVTSSIRVYFDQNFPGGYGWFFPRGTQANVGVGLEAQAGIRPSRALGSLIKKLAGEGLIKARPFSRTGGLVPVGGPLKMHADSLILAGDAAGICHPLTGAGIALAMQSGRLAGEAAAEATAGGNPGALGAYSVEIEALIGRSLRKASADRYRLYSKAGGSTADFCRAVEKLWIAFPRGNYR